MHDTENTNRINGMKAGFLNIKNILSNTAYPRTLKSIGNIINWNLAISSGTFLFLWGNLSNFVVSNKLPMKWIYIMTIIFIGFSVICFSVAHLLLLKRRLFLDNALEIIENHLKEFKKEEPKPKSLPNGEWLTNTILSNKTFSCSDSLIRSGQFSYILGIVLAFIYLILFIIKFL
ncbi:MAG: hypothetical protein GY839_11620 [candidate division Zixibacteria bacterium]|nr:hypothetical protein [candidate division Zixibacteria bacterium]